MIGRAYQDVFSLVVGMVSATVLRHLAEARRRVGAEGFLYLISGRVSCRKAEWRDRKNLRIVHGTGRDAGGVAGIAQPVIAVSANRWNQTSGRSRVGTYEPG